MQLKRNYSSNIQPPTQLKPSFINPLINISNASTPVRTRIVKPGSQLNSTPVNVHKIGIPSRSPIMANKQNDEGNRILGFKTKENGFQNCTGNLSPILALNRKIGQPNKQPQRSFTPLGFKRQQSSSQAQQYQDKLQCPPLQDSRASNSFRNMLDSRSKTPTRSPLSETFNKQNSQTNLLRTSGSANSLLQGMNNKLRQSRNVKMIESKSFEQLINLGSPVNKQFEVLCSNSAQHEKKAKAKYKVVDADDQQLLVYCSKCAINLVQKGFKVEDLTNQDMNKIRSHNQTHPQQRNDHFFQQPQDSQYNDYANQTLRKLKVKSNELKFQRQNILLNHEQSVQNANHYFDSIISFVEEQKKKHQNLLFKNFQKENKQGDHLQKKICEAIAKLGFMLRRGVGGNQVEAVQDIECLLTEKGYPYHSENSKYFSGNLQQKFNNFTRFFQNEGKLKASYQQTASYNQYYQPQSHPSPQPQHYYSQSSNQHYFSNQQLRQNQENPLRFSFEKSLKDKQNQFVFRNQDMNALQEAPQALEGQDSGEMQNTQNIYEKKAFRTLFPQDEDDSNEKTSKPAINSPTFKQI